MKVIGLIGGMSWESSKVYYENINQRVRELAGGSHSCKSVMISVDFAEIEKLTFEGRWDEIGEIMSSCAQKLEAAGADVILLCTNTIHLVSHFIEKNTSIPFLHIADATGAEIRKNQLRKVALLGTRFTMEQDFYTKILEEVYRIDVLIPEEPDRQIVHNIIYDELVKGKFEKNSREECIRIINKLQSDGAEGVILGCTELPILVPESDIEIQAFDPGKIHAWHAVDWALSNTFKPVEV